MVSSIVWYTQHQCTEQAKYKSIVNDKWFQIDHVRRKLFSVCENQWRCPVCANAQTGQRHEYSPFGEWNSFTNYIHSCSSLLSPRGRIVRWEACLTTVPGGSLSGDKDKIISPFGTQNKIDTSIFKTNSGFSDVHNNCMQCHMKPKTISKIKISIGIAMNLASTL